MMMMMMMMIIITTTIKRFRFNLFSQLPPTDSRLRPDCRALENGDLGKLLQR